MPAPLQLAGREFFQLTVLSRAPNDKHGKTNWVCLCSCGQQAIVTGSSLIKGETKSCGCRRSDSAFTRQYKHGLTDSPENVIWRGMKARCTNPSHISFKNYGGRGIRVCDEWSSSFAKFYEDLGPRPSPQHSLERLDNDGPYAGWNCKWATRLEQRHNRRDSVKREVMP